jgi:2-polyprenyl-3-methyl-5-hydroxy-6-metoxy-1,4-benzoquinol methylase
MIAYSPKKRDCPICGNGDFEILFKQKFASVAGVSFLDGYDVVSCNKCGFVYASNIPDQKYFDIYYINSNKYEHEIEQPDTITGRYDNILKEILRFANDTALSIVDVGCARSEILRLLQNNGFSDLTGIDPSIKNINYLKKKNIEGIQGAIGTIDINRQYDIVLFLSVLEHIQDVNTALDVLYRLVADDGMLVVNVPNIEYPMDKELPFQEFSREHINYFTPTSLSNLMFQHDFQSIVLRKTTGELIGMFKKKDKNIVPEKNSRIVQYIEKSDSYEKEMYKALLAYKNVPVVIWGLGTFTQRLLSNKILDNIVAFVDSNQEYRGKKYNNIPIISPDELNKYSEPIILSVSFRYINSIINTINNDLKINNEIIRLHETYDFIY